MQKIGDVDRCEIRDSLSEGIAALGLTAIKPATDALIDYLALLHRWNRAYNLTGVRGPREMVSRHLLDSLAIQPHLTGERILDVGTGAGMPGMILALAFPDSLHATLLDPAAKRIRFLHEVQLRLKPLNVALVRARVEEAELAPGTFGTVTCRAFSSLAQFVTSSAHLVASDGCLLAMKGERAAEEIAALSPPWRERAEVIALDVPGLAAQRYLVRLAMPASVT
ncbi:MAG: 16S rRNA (guanine(527)-N(7))-methyltransferase RsmG [Pseudomonadota bacterium]